MGGGLEGAACSTFGVWLGVVDLTGFVFFGLAPIVFVRPKARPKARATRQEWSRRATPNFFCIAHCGTVLLPFNWNVCFYGKLFFSLVVGTIFQDQRVAPGGAERGQDKESMRRPDRGSA